MIKKFLFSVDLFFTQRVPSILNNINCKGKNFLTNKVYFKFLLIFVSVFLIRCAQIVPLTGGKKDIIPPKLISVSPENYSKNIYPKKITFQFNEKVQLLNPSNIIIVPQLSKNIDYSVKNKLIEIILPDELLSNTTYKIIFNKTIADLTERNTIDYLEYVFSTGDFIDSLFIKGNVKDAFTLNNEKNILIALYDASENDSCVLSKKPLYFTKTNAEGNFYLKNLPDKSFKIFAISDNNNNFVYDPTKEKIGILEKPIKPVSDSIVIFLIATEKPNKNGLKRYYSPNEFLIHLIYSFPDKYKILNPQPNVLLLNDSTYSDTCKILVHHLDTAHLIIKTSTHIDTLNIPINTRKNKTFQLNLKNQYNHQQAYFLPVKLTSDFWIDTNYTKTKIVFYKEKDSLNPIQKRYFQVYPHQIVISYPLEQNMTYTLKIPVKSIHSNDTTEIKTFEIKTNNSETYAQLKVNILFPDKKNYIVAICTPDHKIVDAKYIILPITASNQQSVEFNNIVPGNYLLKLIQDENQNYVWDAPVFLSKQKKITQAEKIFLYPKPIKLINNWDVILDWKDVK